MPKCGLVTDSLAHSHAEYMCTKEMAMAELKKATTSEGTPPSMDVCPCDESNPLTPADILSDTRSTCCTKCDANECGCLTDLATV